MFKAPGIGLCRTEHMFFAENRINRFRSMILAENTEERTALLKELKKDQVDDFYQIFKIMAGFPVTIRLLDAPLHEFLPHTKGGMADFLKYMQKKNKKLTTQELSARCDLLREVNPMLGHRGVRIAVSYPEIYNIQVKAIFEAAYRLKKEGIEVVPEIMIPIVMTASEVKIVRNGKKIEGKTITGIRDIEEGVRKEFGFTEALHYEVGSMIELPAAALQAGEIARYAEFFSFGTNDLTQTTNGLSRDDFNNFFSDYNEFDLLPQNPFKVLGDQVKEMIKIASLRARLARPDIVLGLCGEHGAEPENIPFAQAVGMNYVSCSPYGIPIAKLAIAQMNLSEEKQA
jgi:pyruvate,orthophosphate dikinase